MVAVGVKEEEDIEGEVDLVAAVEMEVVVDDIDPTNLEDHPHVVFG